MLWSVETDADIYAAEVITSRPGWFQGGRLGCEATMGHSDALDAVRNLHESGRRAWMSLPAPERDSRAVAVEGLSAYARARDEIVEAVHAGLEIEMTKTEIARTAKLSRPGLDKIIDRYGLDALVKGD